MYWSSIIVSIDLIFLLSMVLLCHAVVKCLTEGWAAAPAEYYVPVLFVVWSS